MCSPDVGAVGLEGVGLGAQLHELHPPCSPVFPRPGRLAPARLSASFSSQQSRAPMHGAPAARESKQASSRELCSAAAAPTKRRLVSARVGLHASIKGERSGAWRRNGDEQEGGRRRAGQ